MAPRRLAVALLVCVAGTPAGVTLAAAGQAEIDDEATAARVASRGVQWSTAETCDLATAVAVGQRHPEVRQLVIAATDTFAATRGSVAVAVRVSGDRWECQTGTFDARFGRTGTRPLLERRSGDGTTPAGVFPLGEVTAWDGEVFNVFGNRPDPGVRAGVGYRDVRPQDCWGATPNHPDYQHLVNRPECPGPDDEWLPRFGDVYSHAAVIGANLDPISGDEPGEPPYAAAIFLHRHSYVSGSTTRPTSGCVSVPADGLRSVIRLLDPDLSPHFAIGPTSWLRAGS